ncbi:DUF397 domain-containing protein [Streptomyces avermitilis]|uniref:DUF397 domain-containing protein n=1 Tax=Streptomyces avermitilis TaxID=33903 RepID=UPI0033A88CDB
MTADAEDRALKARKERERRELYALDVFGVERHSAPGTEGHEERVEVACLSGRAMAMRSSLAPDTVPRFTEAEQPSFVLGARDGEFDPEPTPHDGGHATERPEREKERLARVPPRLFLSG